MTAVTPAAIFAELAAAGVHIRPDPQRPDGVLVSPSERISEDLRALIVTHKPVILSALRRPAPAPVRSPAGTCAYCGRPGRAGPDLLPFYTGMGPRREAYHVWLHPVCTAAWHAAWRAGAATMN